MEYKETATQELFGRLSQLFDDYRDEVISHNTYEQSKKEALKECMEKERQQILEFSLSLCSNSDDAVKNYVRDEFDKHYDATYLVDYIRTK